MGNKINHRKKEVPHLKSAVSLLFQGTASSFLLTYLDEICYMYHDY